MRSVSVRLADLDRVKINLGIAGENEHTHVLFDCKKAFDQYPNATPFLIVTPPRGDIYPAVVTRDGDIVEWVVTDSDLIYHGNGKVQLQFKQGDIIMKSYEARTSIAISSEPTGTVPTPIQNWITQANAILASIPDDINAALAAAKASGEFDGADGVGIAAITLKSTVGLVDTYTITLTDGMDYDFTVTNGTPGQNGVGIQSIAKTATVGLVDTYTITLTNGQTYPFTVTNGQNGVEIDDNTPANNKVFSSAKVDQELTDVKTAIQGKPDIKDSTKTGVDFDLSDADGNVILRVQDGDVLTKWFTSKNPDGSVDYNADIVYSNTSGTKSIAANFREGDNIILHLADANDRIKDSIASSAVTYKYTDTSNVEHTIAQKYGYLYVPFTFQEDAVSVSVTYSNGLLWGENGVLRFSVYKKGIAERKPHIIRVAADGSGDYTSLRDAIDSIEDNNAYNRYRIEVYPGTYNILADYTAEEINESGFEGLFVGDGISIVGIGQRDDIILYGTIDTNTYNLSKRNDISTINLAGNVELENITINTEYLRYCVHDDKAPLTHQMAVKEIKNCVFNAANMTTGAIAYGCGISNMRKLHFKDCVFNQELHIHTANTGTYSPEVIIENCEGMVFSFADYNSVVDVEYMLPNSKFTMVKGEISYGPHNQFLFINQTGAINPLVDCDEGMIYNLANCFKAKGQITAGQLVSVGRSDRSLVATAVVSSDIANGVSIGHKNGETIIASHGYINSNQVGITGLSVGDYITVDANGVLTDGGTQANAVGVVTGISERQAGGAFIKLFV